ncbi:HlyD family type I secretion periplasmic adaptor subunit [Bradyrhizobium sp. Tv2a-2]|uniref:HlyD family type I secretion periplasmic adaptor subunit n=1 Tax=Bradyrhizobium sp. Tv2a-2 TaxID=113395 RepID=UPI000462F3FD|nr:HlyD family type I secretion periplasmic adaptor subunit [Bradyrhizobium sp. Tv2a-2]
MSRDADALTTVRQFQSETDAIREAADPLFARATVWVLTAFLVATVTYMCLARIDRIVSSTMGSKIVTLDQVNVVQALDPSIIKSIDVHEGEQVGERQLLGTLDPTLTAADLTQYKAQLASYEAQIARDEAELAEKPLVYPKSDDPNAIKYQDINRALFDQQVAQYKAQYNSLDGKIHLNEATLVKLQGDDAGYRQRAEIAQKIEDMRTTLAEHGTGSQLNLYISQDARMELLRQIEYTHNSLIETQAALASAKADLNAFKEQWFAQASQDLVTARNNLDTARANYDKAAKHQDLVRITAVEPSVVLQLAKVSVGSVLKQGDPLVTLMPLRSRLDGELKISSRDIGFLRVGDPCTLKVDAFNFVEHGTAEGTVRWIGDGAFTTDDNGQPTDAYYKVRCSIDQTNFRGVPANFRLIPGMTLTGDIKVGHRSVMMYVVGDMLKGFYTAMREPS